MVQVDLPASFAIGQIFAFLCRDYLKKEPSIFLNKILGPFNVYLACCYAPAGMFLLIGWPAWEVMYKTGWFENPFDKPLVAGAYVLFGIIMVVLGNIGFILAHHWYRKGRDGWVIWGSFLGVFLTVLPFFLQWGIWMNIGDFNTVVEQGLGYSFWDPPFFKGWLAIMGYLAGTLIIMAIWLVKKGNKLEP